jgi:TctA family transporter
MLGVVLGPMMEEHLRKEMLISKGDLMTFIERPISAGILAITIGLFALSAWTSWRKRRVLRRASEDAASTS